MPIPAAPEHRAIALAPMTATLVADVLALGHKVYDTSAKPYTPWSLSAIARHLDSEASACWVALDGERLAGFVLGSMGFDQSPTGATWSGSRAPPSTRGRASRAVW
ncbi:MULTISPECIES: hypothetical protein [Streptomyces]|uniref:hypothetical protein n=1 Tax=Streptomyces TaxID=1883 RepID=UPI001E568BC8|nr:MULTISPECIES: hypothetical protein [Streptomyces]UFQ20522.1 hypothetical protein J2N69_34870 [Streptomyces huasconensis]WCL89350.1 hypothetical protein PPN52_34820 [Streptomyces sp. JCM 35825]